MITTTDRLSIESRPLSPKEKAECEKIVKLCTEKLRENPRPKSFFGKIVDLFNEESAIRPVRESILSYNKSVLAKNAVTTVSCKPISAIYLEEYEDEGHYYILDVGSNTLLFIGSQDYHPSDEFPNEHFTITTYNNQISNHGKKLSSVTNIDSLSSRNILKPAIMITFPGQIESALDDYKSFSKTANWELIYNESQFKI